MDQYNHIHLKKIESIYKLNTYTYRKPLEWMKMKISSCDLCKFQSVKQFFLQTLIKATSSLYLFFLFTKPIFLSLMESSQGRFCISLQEERRGSIMQESHYLQIPKLQITTCDKTTHHGPLYPTWLLNMHKCNFIFWAYMNIS